MGATMQILKDLLLLLGVVRLSFAQAPGDFNQRCREGNNAARHIFPNNWKILMDTYDYQQLFRPSSSRSVWEVRDFDNDGLKWNQVIGGVCSWSLYTCTDFAGTQNNWLFSQYISYLGAKEVFFNVTYRFDDCRDIDDCENDFVTLYRYDANSRVSETLQTDKNNYKPFFGDETSSRLQQPPPPTSIVRETRDMIRPKNNGFYLGIRDSGTCGSVSRIILYYTVCKERQTELVVYPEFATPPQNGPDEIFDARCVDNAHNVTSLQVTAFSRNSSCRDVITGGARCECNAGYQISTDRRSCIACSRGFYRAEGLSTCQRCPANTVMDAVGASQCNCLPGFFRDQREGPDKGCTVPPGPVRNLRISVQVSTSITVSWIRPVITGRSDFYYKINLSNLKTGTKITVNNLYRNDRETVTYTIRDLRPVTRYEVTVATFNGVSDQDPTNDDRRVMSVTGSTTEGVPSPPILNRLCTVVIWRPPVEPAGEITGYELRIGQSPGRIEKFGRDENFYITAEAEMQQNIGVQIRALNSFAASRWTDFLPINCNGQRNCPILPTSSTPSIAPSTAASSTSSAPTPPPRTISTTTSPTQTAGIIATTATPPACRFPYFMMNGRRYNNQSTISIGDVGEGDANALLCMTEFQNCCRTQRIGEFSDPNGNSVGRNKDGGAFYRNRGEQVIRLHHRQSGANNNGTGTYRCKLFDSCGVETSIQIDLV